MQKRKKEKAKFVKNGNIKEHKGLMVFEQYAIEKDIYPKPFARTTNMLILYVCSGSGYIEINSRRIFIGKNTVIQSPPGKNLRIIPETDRLIISGIRFPASFLLAHKISSIHSETFHFANALYQQIWEINNQEAKWIKEGISRISEMTDRAHTHLFGRELILHHILIFLYEIGALTQKYSSMQKLNFSRKEKISMQFSRLVQEHYKRERKLLFYASQLHISSKYLTEVIKEVTGRNAGDFIHELVIMEAKFMLSQNEIPISEISEALHFSDQSFFGKYFKRHCGLSPKAFQKSLQSEEVS